jgi:DNA-directed RNA polymerase subunit RPC12/RpoP
MTEEFDKWLEDKRAEKIKAGIENGSFTEEAIIYCPYCGASQIDAWESVPAEQETWGTYECERCEKPFKLKYEIVYSTEVVKDESL